MCTVTYTYVLSATTEFYDPKTFITHAVLLRQAFAHSEDSLLLPPVGARTVSQFQCGRSPSQVGYALLPEAVTLPTSYERGSIIVTARPPFTFEPPRFKILSGISSGFPKLSQSYR